MSSRHPHVTPVVTSINGANMLAEAPLWLQEWARSRNAAAQPPSVKAELGEPPLWVSKFEDRGLARQNLDTHAKQFPERLRTTDVEAAAELLPNPDLPWDPWNNMLMLFWAVSDGEALDAAHTFSKKSNKYDPAATDQRWQEISKSPPTRMGIGSLIFKVQQIKPNWIPPSQRTAAPLNHHSATSHQPVQTQQPLTAQFRELATMSAVEYDRVRAKEAEALGIRVSTLDDEVGKLRDTDDGSSRAGRSLELPSPEPWPTPVDGAKLLDDIMQAILRFVFMPKEAAVAVALWIVHAYVFEASMITSRLVVTAPENVAKPRCFA